MCLIDGQLGWPSTHYTRDAWARKSNLVKMRVAHTVKIIIRSSHNFAYLTTGELLWQGNRSFIWIESYSDNQNKEGLWKFSIIVTYIRCVKWALVASLKSCGQGGYKQNTHILAKNCTRPVTWCPDCRYIDMVAEIHEIPGCTRIPLCSKSTWSLDVYNANNVHI